MDAVTEDETDRVLPVNVEYCMVNALRVITFEFREVNITLLTIIL